MPYYSLTYELSGQSVRDWLVLGPLISPAASGFGPGRPLDDRWKAMAAQRSARPLVERAPLLMEKHLHDGQDLFWRLEHAGADDRLEYCVPPGALKQARLWAASRLVSESDQMVNLAVDATCPAAVWLNGKPVSFTLQFRSPPEVCLPEAHLEAGLNLSSGENHLIMLLEDEGHGALLLSAQVRVLPDAPEANLHAAVAVRSQEVDYWKIVDQVYASARLDRAVYSGAQVVTLLAPADPKRLVRAVARLQKTSGEIYGEYMLPLRSQDAFPLISAAELPPGEYVAQLMPPPELFYEAHFRPARAIPFRVVYEVPALDGLPYSHRRSLLLQAAARMGGAFGLVASLVIGRSGPLKDAVLHSVLERVRRLESGYLLDWLGLWLLDNRAVQIRGFLTPDQALQIAEVLDDVSLINAPLLDDTDELLQFTAQVLGAQRSKAAAARGVGEPGLLNSAEEKSAAWLRSHALEGLLPGRYDADRTAAALMLLADHAASDSLADLAAVCLDQLMFWLASTHLNGLPDPAGAGLPAHALKTARQLPGAAIGMLLWGGGMLQSDLAGAVCLATSKSYELPSIIANIAADRPDATWTAWSGQDDSARPGAGCVYASFRTPTYRLSSFYPESVTNLCEALLWQAALGPDAVVFSSDPGSTSQAAYRPAGFWRGNARPTDVLQWQDALICRYDSSLPAALGFTHTYFPTEAFDEAIVEEQWAFARLGEGYLALYAEGGLSLAAGGDDAGRELRSPGVVWACQMGQKADDGSFEAFCASNRARPPQVSGREIAWETIRGLQMQTFADGKLAVHGRSPASDSLLISPYASFDRDKGLMTIQYHEDGLELLFD